MPNKPTKSVPKYQHKPGAVKNGKIKVVNSTTGKSSWRSGKNGLLRDWDGTPTSQNHNKEGLKDQPHHTPHKGRRGKTNLSSKKENE